MLRVQRHCFGRTGRVEYLSDELLEFVPTLNPDIMRRGRWPFYQVHLQRLPQVILFIV